MSTTLDIPLEKVDEFAQAARQAINARLNTLPMGELTDYWAIVAKMYAKGSEKTVMT